MARRGRPTVRIKLRAEERATLERWARRHASSQALALRSKIVLARAAGGHHPGRDRGRAGLQCGDGGQMAEPLRRRASRWPH
jgi:hypothetical protein